MARRFLAAPVLRVRGSVVGPPDMVGVGVQKAGTSWWQHLIASHPRVHRIPQKELHFFDAMAERESKRAMAQDYARLFARPRGMLAGEWTPRYMHDPWTIPLLAATAPDTKVLVLLRDPVERFRSGIAHEMHVNGRRYDDDLVGEAFRRGLYARQLERTLAHFSRAQVLVLQYERCVSDPAGELTRTYDFLGLSRFLPPDLDQARNATRREKKPLPSGLRDTMTEAYRADAAEVSALSLGVDVTLWRSLSLDTG